MTEIHTLRPPGNPRPRLFYGYVIVGAAICIQIIGWGLYNSYGVYFNQILAEFSWPRGTISGAYSLSQIVIGISAVFMGSLSDRFGPRLLMTGAGILAALGFVLMSQAGSVWQLYVSWGIIVAIGVSGIDVVLLSTVARWFTRRRGIMSGITKTGTGFGIMAIPIISAWLISQYGWRNTLIILGAATIIIIVASAQLLRRDPSQMKLFPDGAERVLPGAVPIIEAGLTFFQAICSRQFWMLSGVYFTGFFIVNSILVHIVQFAVDLKLNASLAAAMISIIGGVSIAGRLILGSTSDKITCRRTLKIIFILFAAAFIWLQAVHSAWALVIFTVVYGFAHGGFFTLMSPVVAEFFGTRSHGTIFGVIIFFASMGGALGPMITGRIFDYLASYQMAFLILLGMVLIGLVMVSLAAPPQKTAANSDRPG